MPISTIGTNSLSATAQIGSLTTASGSAPSYSARAWVNFNGTGTVAIRASGNVSSITDNNTGDFDINFSSAMPDANYAVAGNASSPGTSSGILMPGSGSVANNTVNKVRVFTPSISGVATDFTLSCVSIFR